MTVLEVNRGTWATVTVRRDIPNLTTDPSHHVLAQRSTQRRILKLDHSTHRPPCVHHRVRHRIRALRSDFVWRSPSSSVSTFGARWDRSPMGCCGTVCVYQQPSWRVSLTFGRYDGTRYRTWHGPAPIAVTVAVIMLVRHRRFIANGFGHERWHGETLVTVSHSYSRSLAVCST